MRSLKQTEIQNTSGGLNPFAQVEIFKYGAHSTPFVDKKFNMVFSYDNIKDLSGNILFDATKVGYKPVIFESAQGNIGVQAASYSSSTGAYSSHSMQYFLI